MPFDPNDIDREIAARIARERAARDWSLADLAVRSGVSRSMLNKVERSRSSPTSALLARIATAFGMTLSDLLARAEEGDAPGLVRAKDRPRWTDPGTGYLRTQILPGQASGFPVDLVEVTMPPGQSVTYPASSYAFGHHAVWVLDGRLSLTLGGTPHALDPGDVLEFGPAAECTYANEGTSPCTYAVAVSR